MCVVSRFYLQLIMSQRLKHFLRLCIKNTPKENIKKKHHPKNSFHWYSQYGSNLKMKLEGHLIWPLKITSPLPFLSLMKFFCSNSSQHDLLIQSLRISLCHRAFLSSGILVESKWRQAFSTTATLSAKHTAKPHRVSGIFSQLFSSDPEVVNGVLMPNLLWKVMVTLFLCPVL